MLPFFFLSQEALLGGSNRDLAAMGKLGSVGDLAAMFEGERDGERRLDAKDAMAISADAAFIKRDGVDTPPLGGAPPAGEGELAQLGSALEAGRAAKRLRA